MNTFLPVTTMKYTWLIQDAGGIASVDRLWLVLGVVLDLPTLGSTSYAIANI